jgi:hypothetical protein
MTYYSRHPKPYEALCDESKAVIDAAIFLVIYDQRLNTPQDDAVDSAQLKSQILDLRNRYAEDIQRIAPKYHMWASQAPILLKEAHTVWKENGNPPIVEIVDLIEQLDHLPPLDRHLGRILASDSLRKGPNRGL